VPQPSAAFRIASRIFAFSRASHYREGALGAAALLPEFAEAVLLVGVVIGGAFFVFVFQDGQGRLPKTY